MLVLRRRQTPHRLPRKLHKTAKGRTGSSAPSPGDSNRRRSRPGGAMAVAGENRGRKRRSTRGATRRANRYRRVWERRNIFPARSPKGRKNRPSDEGQFGDFPHSNAIGRGRDTNPRLAALNQKRPPAQSAHQPNRNVSRDRHTRRVEQKPAKRTGGDFPNRFDAIYTKRIKWSISCSDLPRPRLPGCVALMAVSHL